MKRSAQFSLFKMKSKNAFGGALLKKSNAKEKRPISTKHAMHLVLRSEIARGPYSFLHRNNRHAVAGVIKKQAKRWGLRLYRFENVGNHIHLLVRIKQRRALQGFLRAICGIIPRYVLGVHKGNKNTLKFWDGRPFSRIVTWGRAYKSVLRYFDKNRLQALGFDLSLFVQQMALVGADTG